MHYDAKPLEYCEEETKSFAKKILIYKKTCFRYEREYRIILESSDGKYLPIRICRITLGRRFATKTKTNEATENGDFDANDASVKIARKFAQKIRKSGGYKELPEFCAYKSKYSKKAQKIPPNVLEVESYF